MAAEAAKEVPVNQYEKCIEYIGEFYGIQPTRSGEYIVRGRDGSEYSRWKTIDLARIAIDDLRRHDEHVRADSIEKTAEQIQFMHAYTDLDMVLVNWRVWFAKVPDDLRLPAERLNDKIIQARTRMDAEELRKLLNQAQGMMVEEQ
jgi:hypothetical protein